LTVGGTSASGTNNDAVVVSDTSFSGDERGKQTAGTETSGVGLFSAKTELVCGGGSTALAAAACIISRTLTAGFGTAGGGVGRTAGAADGEGSEGPFGVVTETLAASKTSSGEGTRVVGISGGLCVSTGTTNPGLDTLPATVGAVCGACIGALPRGGSLNCGGGSRGIPCIGGTGFPGEDWRGAIGGG